MKSADSDSPEQSASASGEREPEPVATAMALLARDLMKQTSIQATLDRIANAAVEIVDGCTDAGIMLVYRGQARTLTSTSPMARDLDGLQGRISEGPCFEAARTGKQSLRIVDLTDGSDRWPNFASEARELGLGSMLAFLLYTDNEDPRHLNLGSLNLYSREPGALTDRSEQVGWLLASHAAVALAEARSDDHLNTAIMNRQVIGQAIGILMERHKLTSDDAFGVLSRASQNRNIKLRALAEHLVQTGELPDLH